MRVHSVNVKRHLLAAVVMTGLSAGAAAEGPQDRFWVGLEYFYPTITSTARLDATATARPGSSIRLEDELDLDDRKGTPYINLGMRASESLRIDFEYYALKRDATKSLSRQIDFGDTSFPVGAQINSRFDSTIYRLTLGWSFIKSQEAEAGAAIGLHVTDFEAQLTGQGTGVLAGTGFQRETRDQLVPLPTLGLYGTYVVRPELLLRGRVDFLSLEYQDYDGSLTNWLAALEWRFHKNVAVGLGYRYVDYKLEASKSDFTGEVKYTFKGPTLFINAGF